MNRAIMDLSGEWRFAMDPNEKGTNQCGGWFSETLPDRVHLPGTTSQNFVGIESKVADKLGVIEKFTYRGVAWYQRDIDIPAAWAGRHIELKLERANNTTVWLDNILVGKSDLLQVDQIFDLTNIASPGKHVLTVRNDNSRIRPTHGYRFDFLNGICGEISLTATSKVYMKQCRIMPNIKAKTLTIYFTLGNQTGCESRGNIFFHVHTLDNSHTLKPYRFDYMLDFHRTEKEYEMELYLGDGMKLWDEFTPNLYCLEAELAGQAGGVPVSDFYSTQFGIREFTHEGTQFSVNGKKVILRGDALLHEKYMYRMGLSLYSREDWVKVLKIYKEYGINYLRFHTHCPPNAVFEAADEVGIYMQPELTIGGTNGMNVPGPESPLFDPLLEPTMQRWGRELLDWLHNHPSFVMLTLGNEINGDRSLLERLVEYLRAQDPTRMYAQGSNDFIRQQCLSVNDDFWSTMKTDTPWEYKMARGSYAHSDLPLGPVQDSKPRNSLRDHSESIKHSPVPVIAFELGQYETTCNFDEIERFPKMELPGSMLRYQKMMEEQGLLHKEKDFYRDSGKACLLCYREDIEMIMRTPGMGGFQILSLADIHTDGTAIDGILNAFMENKGMVSAEEWRRYCSDRVVLLRIGKFTFDSGEQAGFKMQFANYGPETIDQAKPYFELYHQDNCLERREFDLISLPQGDLTDLASPTVTFQCDEPAQLVLRVGVEDLADQKTYYNDYNIWVYPVPEIQHTMLTTKSAEEAAAALENGESVLFYSGLLDSEKSVEGFFATNFWSYDMFATASENISETRPGKPMIGAMLAPGTMGISYDPNHPVFRYFPGEGHSDYQWFNVIMNGNPVILDHFAEPVEPIVWTIDTPHRCHRLGLLFELKVGKGKVMVCTTDLSQFAGEAAEESLLKGIFEYMASDEFQPQAECGLEEFKSFFAR